MDSDGNGFSDEDEAVDLDLGFIGLTDSQTLSVTGLPGGLTLNPVTKRITGTITGELGDAGVTIRKVVGTTPAASLPFNLSVEPYAFTGSFEGLIEDGTLPVGRANSRSPRPEPSARRWNCKGRARASLREPSRPRAGRPKPWR